MKLLIGGSPCTHWSIAQTKNRETEPSGLGWELFLNYKIARDKYQPDYFLYENNKSMAAAIRAKITEELGVEPVLINSALVSAQNRQRLYWVGKRNPDGTYSQVDIAQPEDHGILLRDILETGEAWREKAYTLKAQYYKNGIANFVTNGGYSATGVAEPVNVTAGGKAQCLRATYYKDGIRNMVGNTVDRKTYVAEPVRIGTIESEAKNADFDSQQYRVYSPDGKSVTLCGNGGGVGAKTGLYAVPQSGNTYPVYEVKDGLITIKDKKYPIKLRDGCYIIRKLTVTECKRLQTVPDEYAFPVSPSQAYKMLGNGWTVDVIAHIMSHFDGLATEPVEVLSMYDGMSCGHIALDKLRAEVTAYFATEIDKYAIQTTQTNFPETVQMGDAFQVREQDWRIPLLKENKEN